MMGSKPLFMRGGVLAVVLACALLTGCNDDDDKKAASPPPKSSSVIAKDLYDFEPAPPPPSAPPPPRPAEVVHVPPPPPLRPAPVPEPPAAIPEPKFEDPGPLLRAMQVRDLRAMRQEAAATPGLRQFNQSVERASIDAAWRLKDPDYKQRDPRLPEDRSTLPVDRYRVITADRYIGAVLENAVNSQIPGRIIAVVERHVFGADGRLPLLPKGTRIICQYKKLSKVGESRVDVACARALRPDGASIQLTDAAGADQMARTGLVGDVDLRVWERYGSAFVIAGISALASMGNQVSSSQTVQNGGNALSQNLGQVTAKVLEQSVDLAPIVSVPAGSRIHIIPATDLWIREPEAAIQDSSGVE
jgi:type IV secretion system protein VirB10